MGSHPQLIYAYNCTRQTFVATELRLADTHWKRLRGLLGTNSETFRVGHGLWIIPCHGVHTFAMSYPIDVIYLDKEKIVVHTEEHVKPWRMTPVRLDATTVIEVPEHTIWSTGTEKGDQIEIEYHEVPTESTR